ncbi:MAG: RluA family pseudouridine synthase [Bacteroides sp.]|nr:RluA family pseudouridine synthase [Bacteroides sp.]MCM1448264.1 RluA family pseudouridine synthase [Bacteroides sp.]MCM1516058.1 RluA family pseudouridine synthase [Paraprevotella sp.]
MDFLLKQMGITKNRAKDLLTGRAVTVDRKQVTHYGTPLHTGEVVRVARHRQNTMLQNKYVKIVYEDKDLVVIEKNEGILSMASSPKQYCVKTVLDSYFEKRHFKCTAHVVHRLDRETSGLMIYAKNVETAQILEYNWHELVYDRRYVALVCGDMQQEGGTVQSWLKESKSFITYSSPTDNGGKLAITHFHRLQHNDGFSLVEMKLDTGRKNQIRVHMADLGFPIAGDSKYGNGRDPIHRMALHAFRLHFTHPVTGEDLRFETAIPLDFQRPFNEKAER